MKRISLIVVLAAAMASTRAQQPPQPPAQPPQPQEIETTITGEPGSPPRLAVPEFIAVSKDTESVAIAKTIRSTRRFRPQPPSATCRSTAGAS
ncbi:MAG: hypothetical protein AUJ01_08940 [Acidobacteria bacterium 13_1_40CM_3_65_5]|nr:MAG: hypothetical protein AUJ01_08940 [Acidobacteria bacterium 13_1_40CM_3_65_5]